MDTYAFVANFIVFVPCGILVPTPCDNLPYSFPNEFVHIFLSFPGTCPLDNCVYPHSFLVSCSNTWFLYSSSTFIDTLFNPYLWKNSWWCIISDAYPNRLDFFVEYLCITSCTWNYCSSARIIIILLDWFLCGITCGGLFLLIFFPLGDGMVCTVSPPPPSEVLFPTLEVVFPTSEVV